MEDCLYWKCSATPQGTHHPTGRDDSITHPIRKTRAGHKRTSQSGCSAKKGLASICPRNGRVNAAVRFQFPEYDFEVHEHLVIEFL